MINGEDGFNDMGAPSDLGRIFEEALCKFIFFNKDVVVSFFA